MKKLIIICSVICSLLFCTNTAQAQDEPKRITLQAGIGYSPEFELFLVPASILTYDAGIYGHYPYYHTFSCTPVTPLLNFVADCRLSWKLSIALAVSYQSESVYQAWTTDDGGTDFVSRLNIAGRLVYHFNTTQIYLDKYAGLRLGISFWHDNYTRPSPEPYPGIDKPMIKNSNASAPSIQLFYGMAFYIKQTVGFHFEIALGSSYLVETGLNFRFGKQ